MSSWRFPIVLGATSPPLLSLLEQLAFLMSIGRFTLGHQRKEGRRDTSPQKGLKVREELEGSPGPKAKVQRTPGGDWSTRPEVQGAQGEGRENGMW